MSALIEEARKLAGVAERLRGPIGNAANTNALLIEPMLSALGWDTTDVGHVVRDWPLPGHGSVSYALRIDEVPVVFVDARPVSGALGEDSTLSQFAAGPDNDIARWCVRTNGLVYRVLTIGTSGGFALLYEVDLAAVAAGDEGAAKDLALLSRQSLFDGALERRADQLYADPLVRAALLRLARSPSDSFLAAIGEAIGGPGLDRDRLRASLARIFDHEPQVASATPASQPSLGAAAATGPGPAAGPSSRGGGTTPEVERGPTRQETAAHAGTSTVGLAAEAGSSVRPLRSVEPEMTAQPKPTVAPWASATLTVAADADARPDHNPAAGPFRPAEGEHPLVDHLAGKPEPILEMFHQLDEYGLGLGHDVRRQVRAEYIEYLRGRTPRFTLEVYQHRLLMHLWIEASAIQAWWWAQNAARHMIDIRDRGNGESEYSVTDVEQLDSACQLMKLAYEGLPQPQ